MENFNYAAPVSNPFGWARVTPALLVTALVLLLVVLT